MPGLPPTAISMHMPFGHGAIPPARGRESLDHRPRDIGDWPHREQHIPIALRLAAAPCSHNRASVADWPRANTQHLRTTTQEPLAAARYREQVPSISCHAATGNERGVDRLQRRRTILVQPLALNSRLSSRNGRMRLQRRVRHRSGSCPCVLGVSGARLQTCR